MSDIDYKSCITFSFLELLHDLIALSPWKQLTISSIAPKHIGDNIHLYSLELMNLSGRQGIFSVSRLQPKKTRHSSELELSEQI